ncbi:MAG: hypothetical protein IPM79_39625 [Polyangiaceae bacterium]|nr:hypothetical protein [Polyangiaceae bacterium]
MKTTGWMVALAGWIGVGALACGDDSGTGASGTGGDAQGGEAQGGDAQGGQAQGGEAQGGEAQGGGGASSVEALAFVRGALFTADLGEGQTYHDALAAGGEEPAKAAGDFAHDTFLGTTLLGTTENEFLAVDRWTSDANMDAFYSDPDFQAAFGQLFAAPPTFETFERSQFYGWGDLDAADATEPHYVIVVRGRLADTPEAIQPTHDAIAMGGEAGALAAGDVTHVVYLGRQDPREALIFDVWTTSQGLEAFYSDPTFQQAVGGLFESPPAVSVYASNEWHQW